MELLIISESKIKITLTAQDCTRFGLNAQHANTADALTRRALFSILDEVKVQSGFDTCKDKVLMQLYPSKDGGGELFVTRLALSAEGGRASAHPPGRELYRFDAFHDLLRAVRRAVRGGSEGKSELFYADDGKYYLLLDSVSQADSLFFCEYAQSVPIALTESVREHAACLLTPDATLRLAAL